MKLSEEFKEKATTENSVIGFYNNYDEEGRLMRKSRMPEFLTTMKYIESDSSDKIEFRYIYNLNEIEK